MKIKCLLAVVVAVLAVLAAIACDAVTTSPSNEELSSGEQPEQTILDPTSSAEPTPTAVLSLTPTAPPPPTSTKSHSEMATESCERFINENREARGEEPIRFRTRKIWDRRDGTLLLAPQEGGFDAPKFVYTVSENECDIYEQEGRSPTFTAISVGGSYTCGLKSDGSIACWDNRYATPPTDLPPQDIGPNWQIPRGPFASINVGVQHACGVKTDGSVACWGENGSGQSAPPEGSFASVSAGTGSSCGVKTDATIVCWGSDFRDYQGKKLTPPEGTFTSVDTSHGYACGVKTDGHIACWGQAPTIRDITGRPREAERFASLKAGSFVSVSTGGHYVCGTKADGSILCWGDWQYECCGEATAPEDSFTSVSAGGNQSCGVKDDSSVKCWGVLPLQRLDRAEGNCWVREDDPGHWPPQGSLWCWDGSHEKPLDSINSIHVAGSYTCGLRSNGSVMCWGIKERLN